MPLRRRRNVGSTKGEDETTTTKEEETTTPNLTREFSEDEDDSIRPGTPLSDPEGYFPTLEEYDDIAEDFKDAKQGSNSASLTKSKTETAKAQTLSPWSNHVSLMDQFLNGYVSYINRAYAQEHSLKVLQYSLWLSSRLFHFKASSSHRDSLVTLSGHVGWARYINRLFGLPASLQATRTNSWGPGWIGRGMAWSMVAYYPLEHIALLKFLAPKLYRPHETRLAMKATEWSCRFWFLYILLDVSRSLLELKKLNEKQQEMMTQAQNQRNGDNEKQLDKQEGEKEQEEEALRRKRRMERLSIIRNMLYTIPAIQWSLPDSDVNPWFSQEVINSLMWLESIICFYQGISNFMAEK